MKRIDNHFEAVGFLFIGDPHVSSTRIGRRKDDYLTSVLAKLEEAAKISTEKQLFPVILGDLFHRNDDSKLKMLNRLTRVLKSFPVPPLVLEGNHDKGRTDLSDDDALTLLVETGVVQLIGDPSVVLHFDFQGSAVNLVGCAHGQEIPDALPALPGVNVLITHHDMAFGSTYPGSQPLKTVENCAFVVNGHMHDTKNSVLVGETWWHNPGNIEPLSVDLMGHVPQVWEWVPSQPVSSLVGHVLTHGVDLFDLTGLHVQAADSSAAVEAISKAPASQFAAMLQEQVALDANKTDDASVLREDLQLVLLEAGVSEATRDLLAFLANKALPSAGQATVAGEIA